MEANFLNAAATEGHILQDFIVSESQFDDSMSFMVDNTDEMRSSFSKKAFGQAQKSRYFDTVLKVIHKTEQRLSQSTEAPFKTVPEDKIEDVDDISSPQNMRLAIDYEGFIEQVCYMLLARVDFQDRPSECVQEVFEILERCHSIFKTPQEKPLTLIRRIVQLYLGKASKNELDFVKMKAKSLESQSAVHAYLWSLIVSGKARNIGKAYDLVNSALKVWYRDEKLWYVLGLTYEA